MRHWKRVVAIVLIAAAALVIEGWTARAEPTLFKSCTYTRTPGDHGRPPFALCGVGRPGYHYAPELTGRETYPANPVAQSNTPGVGNEAAFFITLSDTALSPTSTIIGQATTIPASQPTTVLEVLIG